MVGAQEDEEIDSLEHVALFHQEKLFACSPSWANKLEEVDKSLLHLQLLMFLNEPVCQKVHETPMYLT